MIGLDTNVLVRYIMQDDPKQSPKANQLIESLSVDEPGFIPVVVIIELSWVLSRSYGLSREQLAQAIEALLRTREIRVDRNEQVLGALRLFKSGAADFSDYLIERIAKHAGCHQTMTFDVAASRAASMRLIQ